MRCTKHIGVPQKARGPRVENAAYCIHKLLDRRAQENKARLELAGMLQLLVHANYVNSWRKYKCSKRKDKNYIICRKVV